MNGHPEKQQTTIYPVERQWSTSAHADKVAYQAMYDASVTTPDVFWAEHGKCIDWFKPFTKVKNTCFALENVAIKWFEDGTTNVSYNCIDRHLEKRGDQIAIIWECDDPSHDAKITFRQLHARVMKWANVLRSQGIKKGDRVTIYLPMIPEAAYAMLACARIGAGTLDSLCWVLA